MDKHSALQVSHLRADSGFCRNQLMSWCESNKVDYVFGLARNQRLRRIVGLQMWQATEQWNRTGKPARIFAEFSYETKSTKKRPGWDRQRRVIAKAEHIDGKENPRFVVTSLNPEQWPAQALYQELYCARGDMENRIKEQFSLLPIGSAPKRCEPTSFGCICQQWRMCW